MIIVLMAIALIVALALLAPWPSTAFQGTPFRGLLVTPTVAQNGQDPCLTHSAGRPQTAVAAASGCCSS